MTARHQSYRRNPDRFRGNRDESNQLSGGEKVLYLVIFVLILVVAFAQADRALNRLIQGTEDAVVSTMGQMTEGTGRDEPCER